jgi:hypothetical protein
MNNYLYGDSSPSGLTSNFLEFLRDALDFSVHVLLADEAIKAGRARIEVLRTEAAAEEERLDAFVGTVADAILRGDKGLEGSFTARCAARLAERCSETQAETMAAIQSQLAGDVAAVNAAENAARAGCIAALSSLLAPHVPPDATLVRRIALSPERVYAATLSGSTSFGLTWTFDLGIAEGSTWTSPLRLERIASPIELRAPQVTGWISKEVKVRPIRIEKHVVVALETTGQRTRVELRAEPTFDSGFDFDVDLATGTVQAVRVAPSEDGSAGPFAIQENDASIVLALVDKLQHDASTLEPGRLIEAALDGAELRSVESFAPLVDRLVGMLAPIVREIAARSLTANELVLRRALADDRREEFFLAKSTLRDKLAVLDVPLRAHFTPLALEPRPAENGASAAPPAPAPVREKADSRSEIPSSKPVAPPPPPPPRAAPAVDPSPKAPPAASIAPASQGRNERFVEAVKKIVLVLKSGRTDEGYQQYADLLRDESFTAYRPDDQRQAIKMLLLAKPPAVRTEPVNEAYRVAIERIQELVDAHADPMDYEMLGVAKLQLDERKAAATAFAVALKLERARNPASDLAQNLERRLSQVG